MRDHSDESLIESVRAGRPEALDELYRRHAGRLLVFCARSMGVRDPEDVVHDVFARVIEAVDQFDAGRASFRSWLYRIARNRCIDLVRREKIVGFVPLAPGAGASRDGASADDKVIAKSIAEAVRSCLDALSRAEERQAIVLYYLTGKVYREIGEALGRSTSMAQKWVRSAKVKLRHCLERRGVTA